MDGVRMRQSTGEWVIPYAVWRRLNHSELCTRMGLKA